ncbi:MAG: hypothetical protein LUC97_00095 [Clostridiales bacterium]|nr:hypothetical protein [Clostridiales bacterium]
MKKLKKITAIMLSLTMVSVPCLSYGAETENENLTSDVIISDETVSGGAVTADSSETEVIESSESYSLSLASAKAGNNTSGLKETITYTLEADPTLSTLNGYISEITYNPNAVTPTLIGNDLLGENSFGVNIIDCGVFSAIAEEEGKLIICWADADYVALENSIGLAEIFFDVIPNGEFTENEYGTFTEISSRTYQIARYADVMAEDEYSDSDTFSVESEG